MPPLFFQLIPVASILVIFYAAPDTLLSEQKRVLLVAALSFSIPDCGGLEVRFHGVGSLLFMGVYVGVHRRNVRYHMSSALVVRYAGSCSSTAQRNACHQNHPVTPGSSPHSDTLNLHRQRQSFYDATASDISLKLRRDCVDQAEINSTRQIAGYSFGKTNTNH